VLRDAFARHGGVEVDTQGDAFFVAFPTAPGALAAASDALDGLAIPVRMGVHTGTPLLTDEGYVGTDVHRAARIAAAGHGRQVLVSATTAALVEPDGLRDLGEHRLKDLSAPERIYQLGKGDFPRLKTLYQTNLPVPATPFVGRERELAEVGELLLRDDVRLLTLTGAGGSGKTRLALQAAAGAADAYPQGVWWVPLASVRDHEAVAATASRALGGGPLAETIGDRRLLLVLDNFEHVVEAAPEVAAVLERCPAADVVVTSRERLQLAAEHLYPVPVLAREDSRALFLGRARAVRPDLEADAAVDELCARLDDLPLALELAAARTRILQPEQLLSRLGERLDLLKGGRDADVRQHTLRATIAWSYELLAAGEQQLFARLALFRGGCTLEAAESVCDADLDGLQSLVDKSLLRLRDDNRFWMLETIREYAVERLRELGEEDELRRRHAEFFLALARSAHLSADAVDLGPRPELVAADHDNLRSAIDWAGGSGDYVLALELATALDQFWVSADPGEGARRVEALLQGAGELPRELRAKALRTLGGTLAIQGEFERGAELHQQSLDEFLALGDEQAVAHLLARLAVEAGRLGDADRARALTDESLVLHRRVGSPAGEATALGTLSNLERQEGHLEEALELARRSAAAAASIGWTWWQGHYLYQAGECALDLGRLDEGELLAREAVRLSESIGDRQIVVYALAVLARASSMRGRPEEAGVLWGAVEAEEERALVGQWEDERKAYAAHVDFEPPEFGRGRLRGRSLSLADAVEYALSLD
jgi:predicted ATPase